MPIGPNPLFVGRGEELAQLAAELVHRYGCFFAGGVLWLSFASPEDIPLQVAALTRRFGDLDIAEEASAEAFATAIERWQATAYPATPAPG
jgi:hypothetical protein